MAKIFNFIKTNGFFLFLFWLKNLTKGVIVVNAWVMQNKTDVIHTNLGDDLNVYLLKELTGKPVVIYFNLWRKYFNYSNYMCIGSIIEEMTNNHSIIWGAGAMYGGNHELSAKPKKVLCVRGKKTRDFLLSKGVPCPEVYGDPAILLPLVYMPKMKKKYRLGIVPHKTELNHPVIDSIKSHKRDDICIVNVKDYDDWHSVIDILCSCDKILSSSLHGLIISNAYGVPNRWIKLSDNILGGNFKYLDYYSALTSIPLNDLQLDLSNEKEYHIDVLHNCNYYTFNIQENVKGLLESCPLLEDIQKKQYIKLIPSVYKYS